MSLQKTKAQMLKLLEQNENKVIALSGKWGTGKTHLWNEIKVESGDNHVKNSLYASLFGLSSVDQIKRKLIENAIPGVDSHGGIFDGIKALFNAGIKAGSAHYKAMAAISDINMLLMAPAVLRGKIIVIDDIERKHQKLGIDEVLGFIDEYSRQHDARFVLVLNNDQLSSNNDQKLIWETFREKVIDQEVKLSTSPEEAFAIAIKIMPSKYSETIKRASIICSLTNIRIVTKIIGVANQILGDRGMDEAIQARVVPSVVLFSAIHYRGMDDGPDFGFALNVANSSWGNFFNEKSRVPTPEERRKAGWRMLMQELGIYGCDDFEKQLVEYLESGLFEEKSVEAVISRYIVEIDGMRARETALKFHKRACWDHQVDEAQLVLEASGLPSISHHLDPYVASALQIVLAQLPGGAEIGEAIIDNWIADYRGRTHHPVNDENPFNNPLHTKIKTEFSASKAIAQTKVTVVDACVHIMEKNGWGTMQEVALKGATADDFEAAMRMMSDVDLFLRFMRHMINMRINRATYDPHFGTATERFVEACRSIAGDATSSRLARIVRRLFEDSPLSSELTPRSDSSDQVQSS